ncbi:hypothetical protein PFICI_09308 [Pestalotiopsis fici W106-1]|uniref:Plasma membrane fusion protein PRM1 n=1 Tax=Pestalotiopsis fici (strain W106-1 / CGMCC3.15140) TaxID=1229662 RepID=W3X028_PESFW|nr:uncharacterized protein PFICI_09308 [Pestalotiopsis fici W106-1]ETS79455.1 hypothetical protein PFICI_09308 [Pestalotiopsis fici W106-1]
MDSFRRKLANLPGSLKSQPVDSRAFEEKTPTSTTTTTSEVWRRNGTTPYLGLNARLSQVWFNKWTVLLLLVLLRVLLLIGSLNGNLGDAKVKALSACTKVEDVGSAMASMPHYLSVGVNRLAAAGITDVVHGMMKGLDLILIAVRELILFVINMMTSTYTCLIAAAVHGGLNVTALVITKATDEINSALPAVADTIGDAANDVNDAIDTVYSWIDTITSVFSNGEPDKPSIDLTDELNTIKNYKIDTTGFVSDLDQLNEDLPTFKDVQNLTAEVVDYPFKLIRDALNETYGNWKFDENVFPVAQKEALSFCSDNSSINDFFEGLFELVATAKKWFIAILVILAVAVCVLMAFLEIRSWRRLKNYRNTFVERKFDETDMMMMSGRPFPSKIALKVSDWLNRNKDHKRLASQEAAKQKRETLIRWAVAYGTTLPALFVLSLAIAGLFSCLCQYIMLRAVEKEIPALANEVGDFANEVVSSLQHVSQEWSNDVNGQISIYSNEINNDILGHVRNATDIVNNTLNTFTDAMDDALTTVFKGTILMDPIQEVIYCLIGLKVEAVQKGLTWIHDHANISFPTLPDDVFSLGANESVNGDSELTSFLSTPSSATTDEVSGAVTSVTDAIRSNIIQEALISLGLLLVYVLVVLIGITRMLVGMTGLGYDSKGGPAEVTSPSLTTNRPPGAFRSASEASADRRKFDYGEKHNSSNLNDNPFGSEKQIEEGEKSRRETVPPSYYYDKASEWCHQRWAVVGKQAETVKQKAEAIKQKAEAAVKQKAEAAKRNGSPKHESIELEDNPFGIGSYRTSERHGVLDELDDMDNPFGSGAFRTPATPPPAPAPKDSVTPRHYAKPRALSSGSIDIADQVNERQFV